MSKDNNENAAALSYQLQFCTLEYRSVGVYRTGRIIITLSGNKFTATATNQYILKLYAHRYNKQLGDLLYSVQWDQHIRKNSQKLTQMNSGKNYPCWNLTMM